MTFATEKEKIASERFQLVRISAKIDVTADDVASVWGRKVLVTGYPVAMSHLTWSKALYDADSDPYSSETFTQVFTEPTGTMTDKTWYYEASTGYVHFNSTTTDTVNNTYRQYIVVREFLTGNIARYAPQDPEVPGDNVLWKPVLSSYPEVSFSIDDISTGVFSYSAGSIQIINDGNFLGRYFAATGSLQGQEVKIWQCINDVSNVKLLYSGRIANGSIVGKNVNLNILDSTSDLNRSAAFNFIEKGNTAEVYMVNGTTKSIRPDDIGKPIPRHFFRVLPYLPNLSKTLTNEEETDGRYYKGICTDYVSNGTNTENREWICGILSQNVGSDSLDLTIAQQSFGSITRAVVNGTYAYFFVNSMSNVFVNHSVTWTESATTYYGHVARSSTFDYLGNDYNLSVLIYDTAITPVVSTSSTFTAAPAINVHMERDNAGAFVCQNLVYGLDFTVAVSSTGHVFVTLEDAFETNYAGAWDNDSINPDTMRMYYTYYVSGDLNHATVLDYFITASGLSIDSTTFDAAAAALAVDTAFSIPGREEQNFGVYADYVAMILGSTGGYVTLNDSNLVEYHLFEEPSAGEQVTSAEFSNLSIDIEYQDTYDKLIVRNDEWINGELTGVGGQTWITRANRSLVNRQLRELVDARRTKTIKNVLEGPSDLSVIGRSNTATENRLLWLNSNRRLKVVFSTATKHIDANPGDDITLVADNLPGGVSSLNLKIVKKTTNGKETTIEALDFADYPG